MKSAYAALREQAWAANMEIPARGLAIYTWGNVSAFDAAAGVFAIKPSGVAYPDLTPESMVVVDLEGRTVEGGLNPSSDTRTHLELYRAFPGVGGVTHTHSPWGVAWAQARLSIPVYGTTHADHASQAVPCTRLLSREEVAGDYEAATGRLIVETFRNLKPLETPMALVAGHGPFAWGETAAKSVYNAAVLEEVAKMAYATRQLAPEAAVLPDYILAKHWERKHGAGAYYGQRGGSAR